MVVFQRKLSVAHNIPTIRRYSQIEVTSVATTLTGLHKHKIFNSIQCSTSSLPISWAGLLVVCTVDNIKVYITRHAIHDI